MEMRLYKREGGNVDLLVRNARSGATKTAFLADVSKEDLQGAVKDVLVDIPARGDARMVTAPLI